MNFLEKDLEQIIFEQHESKSGFLADRGLNFSGKCYRQKRIGNYGIADLIFIEKPSYTKCYLDHIKGVINIVELKKDKISVSSFFQALGYVKGVHSFLKKKGLEDYFDFKITLIGSEIDLNSTLCYLPDFLGFDSNPLIGEYSRLGLELYTYTYKIDGINFKNEWGYKLANEGL